MEEIIYFSKVEFRECIGCGLNSILLVNLVEGTLSYQAYDFVLARGPMED